MERPKSDAELKAAQEVINNKQFIYQTNQALQTLKQGIVSLNLENAKTRAQASSDNKALSIEFENLKDSVLEHLKKMEQRVGDVETTVLHLTENLMELENEVSDQDSNIQNYWKSLRHYIDRISELEDRVSVTKRDCERSVESLKIQVKDQLHMMNIAFSPKPITEEPAQQRIDRIVAVWKVDFDGLVKEIALLKKSVGYGEKKFENIYMVIDRLKAGTS